MVEAKKAAESFLGRDLPFAFSGTRPWEEKAILERLVIALFVKMDEILAKGLT